MPGRIDLRRYLIFIVVLTLTAGMGGPASGQSAVEPQVLAGPEGAFRLVDHFGRERVVNRPVKRVIVLGGAAAETIWALGGGDTIIARSEWTNWPPPMEERPSIGSPSHPNLELIWRLKPDLVIADSHFYATAERVESLGVPVVFLNGYVQPQVRGMVQALGQLFERPAEADRLMRFLDHLSGLLADRVGGLAPSERPRVFMGFSGQLYFTSNRKSGRRLIGLAGGINIADSLPLPYQRVSAEWVVDQAPDHLVLGADLTRIGFKVPGPEYMAALKREILNRPEMRGLKCAAQGRVHLINYRIGYGLRNLIGAVHLAKSFHPRLMSGVDPRAIHRKMLDRFFGLDLEGTYFLP